MIKREKKHQLACGWFRDKIRVYIGVIKRENIWCMNIVLVKNNQGKLFWSTHTHTHTHTHTYTHTHTHVLE